MTNSKQGLRRDYRKRRLQALADHHALQTVIAQKVLDEIRIRHTRSPFHGHLGLYSPLPGEVDLTVLRSSLEGELKLKLALPAADGQGHLSYHAWGPEPLIDDGCGIPAPLNQPPLTADQLDLLLVLDQDQNLKPFYSKEPNRCILHLYQNVFQKIFHSNLSIQQKKYLQNFCLSLFCPF